MENSVIQKTDFTVKIETQLPALHLATCKDKLREYWNFIKISKREYYYYAAATNGHILAEINFSKFFAFDIDLWALPESFYISSENWKALNSPKTKFLNINFESLLFKVFDKTGKSLAIFEAITEKEFSDKFGKYVDYLPFLDKKEYDLQPVQEIGFNPELFANLGKAMTPAGVDCNGLKLTFVNSSKQVFAEPIQPEFRDYCRGLIMPVMIIE